MRSLVSFLLVAPLVARSALAQTTWYVDDDGAGNGSGTINDPYTSIQYAIVQSQTLDGDILVVLPGDYIEDVNLAGKRLAILGSLAGRPRVLGVGGSRAAITAPPGQPAGTVLENLVVVAALDGSQRCLAVEANADLAAEQLRFEGGKDPFLPDPTGGQVRVGTGASLRLLSCELRAVEDIQRGGAVVVDRGNLTLLECELEGAFGASQGRGGILDVVDGDLRAMDCVFRDGYVDDLGNHGGAIALVGATAWLQRCQFIDAMAFQAEAGAIWSSDSALTILGSSFLGCWTVEGSGGAILVEGGTFDVKTTDFADCASFDGDGGAIYLDPAAQATFEYCTFQGNFTDGGFWGVGDGGAVFGNAVTQFRNCVFVKNVAAGFPLIGSNGRGGALTEAALVQCCTFYANRAGSDKAPGEGGAVAAGTVSSSIVWGNHFPDAFAPGVVATSSNVQGGWDGERNIDAGPVFCDADSNDFSLCVGSPSIDAGQPDKPLDPDGTPPDQGAIPFTWMPVGSNYCAANANSTGLGAVMTLLGSSTLEKDFLRLRATSLPPLQFGYFMASDSAGFLPNVGGGMGDLCLGTPFLRLNKGAWGKVLFSGLGGRFDFRARLLDLPPEWKPVIGETWHFQAWFRDVVGRNFTSNTSDGVRVILQ